MAENEYRPQAGAVLDIGGSVGALLVATGADLAAVEIELFDLDGRAVMHTEVHARTVDGATQYAGLFPSVPAGSYLLDLADGSGRHGVTVAGGQVTVLELVRPG